MKGRKVDMYLLKERHVAMLEYQREIYPFPATIRELCAIWFLSSSSTATVSQALEKMVELGWALKSTKNSHYNQYYAIERNDNAGEKS